ncbi:nitroreductase family protein [uncultured Eubacterium sp.]|uniref:nitroreductase family protein n=1 Tax=uncultured Eubacterium sp. TaxID=165185 RepID=UPI002805A121|nr:nitroreductase family protein [uncultured Eubacterium sp.]
MEFNNILQNRRSIRNFDTDRPVTKEQIEELIKYAIYAPSWKNSQTARYYCAVDGEGRETLSNCLLGTNKEKSAGAALIVTTFIKDRAGFDREGNPDNECKNGWGFYDLGLANENLLLKATEMGLGTLVMGIRDGDALRKVLSIPENQIVVSVIAVGYPAEAPQMPKRKTVDDVTTWI